MSILVILAPIDRVSPSFSKILEYSSILKKGDWDAVLGNSVAVGMAVARHPPRRSLRAALPHRAPTLGSDTKAR
jgi:hypothetical protein